MLKPVKKIITESGETRIITIQVREEKAIQTEPAEREEKQATQRKEAREEQEATQEGEEGEEEEEEYELHPKLQELLEYFVRDDKFTIISHNELSSFKNEIASLRNELSSIASLRNDLGEIKMMLKVLKSKQNNGKYND